VDAVAFREHLLRVQSQQLPTESQVFEDEVLPGTESAHQPPKKCGWRIVISPATGHVTLLHSVVGLERVALVVADLKGIRDG
jgi:hypothetical protein